MLSLTCEVVNRKGLHARAAAKIVALVVNYPCQVTLTHKQCSAPADSLLKLLTLNAPQGSQIVVKVNGEQSHMLAREIQLLFQSGFGE